MATNSSSDSEEGSNSNVALVPKPQRAIPKFSSFKPVASASKNPTPTPAEVGKREKGEELEQEEEKSRHRHRSHRSRSRERGRRHGDRSREKERDRNRDKDRERRRDRGRDREPTKDWHRGKDYPRRHHRSSPRERHRSTSKAVTTAVARRSPTPDSWNADKKQYFVDTKGDPHNLIYGTLHRYSIPNYRRYGNGSVVGLNPRIRIEKDEGDGKGLVLSAPGGTNGRRAGGKSGLSAFARFANGGGKRMKIIGEAENEKDYAFEQGMDYISISNPRKGKKRKHGVFAKEIQPDESSGSELDNNHYRSIEGLKKPSEIPDDKDLQYTSSSDSDTEYVIAANWDNLERRKAVELVRKVDAEPKNVDAWLAYVAHQDILLSVNRIGHRTTAAEKTSTAEIKLDILQKAIEKNQGDERLLLKFMDVAEQIWDPNKILNKWHQMLKENPTATSLWSKYINFKQTDFLSFTYRGTLECFGECFSVLRNAIFKIHRESKEREKLEDIAVYIFLRASLFMREAGFVENAIAAWQVLLEMCFFRPPEIKANNTWEYDKVLEELEKFWDSEVLRIGEPGAKGWNSYVASNGNGEVPKPQKEAVMQGPLDPEDPFGSWIDAELEWVKSVKVPARTIDEVEEDDPYRVVLFSDLRPVMFLFETEKARQKLVDAFLIFHRLPMCYDPKRNSSNVSWATDTFLRNEIRIDYLDEWFWPNKGMETELITFEGMASEGNARLGENPFEFSLRNFPSSCESYFSRTGQWFGDAGESGRRFDSSEEKELIREVLKMLIENGGNEELALYYLAWEWRNARAGVKKVAKSLLKKFRTSLQLWNAYAQIEWADGNIEAARNVYSTALAMSKGFPEASRRDTILLWKSWVWEELCAGDLPQAIGIILSIETGKLMDNKDAEEEQFAPGDISPAVLLKTRRFLEDQQGLMLSMGYIEHGGNFNEMRALLEYLVPLRTPDVTAAITVFDGFIAELERRGLAREVEHELCLMRKARLLYHHVTTAKIFKMATMRSALESALSLFPKNTAFLGLYSWNEGRARIEGKVRKLRDAVLEEGKETVIAWVWAIWAEIRMDGIARKWNTHAVRGLFERAVECDRTKSSVLLWMMYVDFELKESDHRRAKEAFFRGIKYCPWSKDLALMAFTKLRSALSFEEMRKLVSIISSEKELRVHDTTELEDMIEDMDEGQRRRLGASGEGGGVGERQLINLPYDASSDEEMDNM